MRQKYFVVHLKGKTKPNDMVVGTEAQEKDDKLIIKDGDQVVASFSLSEVQGWNSLPIQQSESQQGW